MQRLIGVKTVSGRKLVNIFGFFTNQPHHLLLLLLLLPSPSQRSRATILSLKITAERVELREPQSRLSGGPTAPPRTALGRRRGAAHTKAQTNKAETQTAGQTDICVHVHYEHLQK